MFVYPSSEALLFSDWLPVANNRIISINLSDEAFMFSNWLSVAEDWKKHVGPVGTTDV